MRPALLGFLLAAAVSSCPFPAVAQLPVARLSWIFPAGAAAGSTNEVTIAGSDLDDPVALRFSDARVTASPKPAAADRFLVVVPAEVPEGLLDVRFAGRFGLSNPRAFAVGKWAESTAPTTNALAGSAVLLPSATTVNGRTQPNAEAWFRFDAVAGQRVFARVEARELESRMVPDLAVLSLDGRELATVRRRQLLDFRAPTNGPFLLRLSDQMFRGGDGYHYRLTLGTGPHVDFAVPNVLRAGVTNHVALYGRGLPGAVASGIAAADGTALERLELDIIAPVTPSPPGPMVEFLLRPAAAVLSRDAFVWRWTGTNGPSNPLFFGLTTNAVVAVPVDALPTVVPPCEVSGLFPARGHAAGVTFQARKGEVYWLEVFADRLGFSADPLVVVQRERSTRDPSGAVLYADVLELGDTDANVGDREFNTASRDAAARFEAPQDGTYRVTVRDLFNAGDGQPRLPYRLSIRRENPDFELIAFALPPARIGEDRNVHVLPVSLRRGQTVALKVVALRRDGFNGDIGLSATGLPAGLTASATRIPGGQNSSTLLLTASADASGSGQLTVQGNAKAGETALVRNAAMASVIWPVPDFNNENAVSRLVRESVVSVVDAESAPVSLVVADGKPLEAPADGRLALPFQVIRRGEFQGAFSLKPAGHPALDKAKEIAVAEKATNAVGELAIAELGLPAGTHTLWLQGTVSGRYRNNPEALAAAEAALKAAEQAVASASGDEKPKAEERRKAAEAARKSAEDKAKPRDMTLPVWSQPFVVTVLPSAKPEAKK